MALMSDLRIGDLVRVEPDRLVRRIESFSRAFNSLRTVVGNVNCYWYASEVTRLCRNCHKHPDTHADDGRCLFGASTWR